MTSQILDGAMLHEPTENKIYFNTQGPGNIFEETKNKAVNMQNIIIEMLKDGPMLFDWNDKLLFFQINWTHSVLGKRKIGPWAHVNP